MTRTIWLASYPKSGNTWFRMLAANLSAEAPVDINNLPEGGGIASARGPFDYLSLIDSGLLTPDEIDGLRPHIHEALAQGASDDEHDTVETATAVRFVKVHDAYTFLPGGDALLGGHKSAAGAIVIVRDPRDVAPSLANHLRVSLDEAITFMSDSKSAFCGKVDRQPIQLRQKLLGWSGHLESWLTQMDIPVHLVRYEDLQADGVAMFRRALEFAGYPASDGAIARAFEFADFGQLRRQENEKGFREAPRSAGKFFRRGEAGAWRDELNGEQVARIEAVHAPMMRRLGYELAGAGALAQAG